MRAIRCGIAILVLAAIGATDRALAQDADAEFGKREFLKSCASCHGEAGKGDGPAAKSLAHPAADLTKLAKNNNGVFPIVRVYNVIDGRIQIIVHGSRQMPAWGEVYTQGLKDRMPQNFMSKEMLDAFVRERILMLVEYISTLQEK